jgi:hypothetical protein
MVVGISNILPPLLDFRISRGLLIFGYKQADASRRGLWGRCRGRRGSGPSPFYSAGLRFELTGVAQGIELA